MSSSKDLAEFTKPRTPLLPLIDLLVTITFIFLVMQGAHAGKAIEIAPPGTSHQRSLTLFGQAFPLGMFSVDVETAPRLRQNLMNCIYHIQNQWYVMQSSNLDETSCFFRISANSDPTLLQRNLYNWGLSLERTHTAMSLCFHPSQPFDDTLKNTVLNELRGRDDKVFNEKLDERQVYKAARWIYGKRPGGVSACAQRREHGLGASYLLFAWPQKDEWSLLILRSSFSGVQYSFSSLSRTGSKKRNRLASLLEYANKYWPQPYIDEVEAAQYMEEYIDQDMGTPPCDLPFVAGSQGKMRAIFPLPKAKKSAEQWNLSTPVDDKLRAYLPFFQIITSSSFASLPLTTKRSIEIGQDLDQMQSIIEDAIGQSGTASSAEKITMAKMWIYNAIGVRSEKEVETLDKQVKTGARTIGEFFTANRKTFVSHLHNRQNRHIEIFKVHHESNENSSEFPIKVILGKLHSSYIYDRGRKENEAAKNQNKEKALYQLMEEQFRMYNRAEENRGPSFPEQDKFAECREVFSPNVCPSPGLLTPLADTMDNALAEKKTQQDRP